jgi:hypothetical protein
MASTSISKRKDEEGNLVVQLDPYRTRDSGDAAGDHTGAAGTVIYDISASAPSGAKIYPTRFRIRELANAAGLVYIYFDSVSAANLIEEFYLAAYEEMDIVYEGRGGSHDIVIKSATSTDIFCGADVLVDSEQRATE